MTTKLLIVNEEDIDCCHDTLKQDLAKAFIVGGCTHIKCNGRIHEVEVYNPEIGPPMVFVGEEIEIDTEKEIKVDELKVYDPRIDEFIISDNPALILGYLISRGNIKSKLMEDNKKFWSDISDMANFLESKQDIGE